VVVTVSVEPAKPALANPVRGAQTLRFVAASGVAGGGERAAERVLAEMVTEAQRGLFARTNAPLAS
jgi:hypothetical protein